MRQRKDCNLQSQVCTLVASHTQWLRLYVFFRTTKFPKTIRPLLWKTRFVSRATYPCQSFSAPTAVYLSPTLFRGPFFRCFYYQIHHVRRTAVYVISTININTYGTRAREFHPLIRQDLRRRVYRGQLSCVYRVQASAGNLLLLRRFSISTLSPIFAFGGNLRRLMAVTASRLTGTKLSSILIYRLSVFVLIFFLRKTKYEKGFPVKPILLTTHISHKTLKINYKILLISLKHL